MDKTKLNFPSDVEIVKDVFMNQLFIGSLISMPTLMLLFVIWRQNDASWGFLIPCAMLLLFVTYQTLVKIRNWVLNFYTLEESFNLLNLLRMKFDDVEKYILSHRNGFTQEEIEKVRKDYLEKKAYEYNNKNKDSTRDSASGTSD